MVVTKLRLELPNIAEVAVYPATQYVQTTTYIVLYGSASLQERTTTRGEERTTMRGEERTTMRGEERTMTRERDNDGHNPTPFPTFVWVGFFSSWLPCPPVVSFFFSFFYLSFTLCCLPPAFCMGAIYFSLSNTVTLSPSH